MLPRFPYQDFAYERMVKLKRTALISKPGSAKTRPTAEACRTLGSFDGKRITIIIASSTAFGQWQRQLQLWAKVPANRIVLQPKNATQRRKVWASLKANGGVYICTYMSFLRDLSTIKALGAQVMTVIADEYHKAIRKHNTKTFAAFRTVTLHTPVVFMLTGSGMNKHPGQLWTALNTAAPKRFTSYWKFVDHHCLSQMTDFGWEFLGIINIENLRKVMDEWLVVIPPEVVASQLPNGLRSTVVVRMDDIQNKVYDQLAADLMAILPDGELIATPTQLSLILQLRKLLCCPKLINDTFGYGPGLEHIVESLEDDSHAVIFVPFKEALEHVRNALREAGYYNVFILQGGITTEEQQQRIAQFKSTRGIIVCTTAYGESYDLETCNNTWFLGYDFNSDNMEQCEGRTQRAISGHEFVRWRYIKYAQTIDEHFLAQMGQNRRQVARVMNGRQQLIDMLNNTRREVTEYGEDE